MPNWHGQSFMFYFKICPSGIVLRSSQVSTKCPKSLLQDIRLRSFGCSVFTNNYMYSQIHVQVYPPDVRYLCFEMLCWEESLGVWYNYMYSCSGVPTGCSISLFRDVMLRRVLGGLVQLHVQSDSRLVYLPDIRYLCFEMLHWEESLNVWYNYM